jgi:hypothetical protein
MCAFRCCASAVFALLAGLMLGACSSTNLVNLWVDEQASASPIDNILVVALARDAGLRRSWEDALSAEFQAQGLLARPSYHLFPASLPDSQQVAVVLGRDRHDAALVVHRLAVTPQAEPKGGYRDNAPAASDDYWRRGYTVAFTAANRPPEAQADKKKEARYQMDLARHDGRLIWTGTTVPVKATDAQKLRSEVAGQVVPELQRRKIIED